MNLPDDFVKTGLKLAHGLLLFGKPLDEMTREELIAAAAQGWNAERKQRENQYTESKNCINGHMENPFYIK